MRFAVLMVAALIVSACGGSDGASTPEAGPRDDEARAMLLTVDDFPSGWSETPHDTGADNTLSDQCDADAAPGLEGSAESGDFSNGRSAELREMLALFESEAAASSAMRDLATLTQCMVDALNDGAADDDEFTIGDASVARVSFPRHGDEQTAARLSFRAKRRNESGPLNEADAYIDIVSVRTNATLIHIMASDVLSPYDTDALADSVAAAVAKAD